MNPKLAVVMVMTLCVTALAPQARAAAPTDSFDYPELMVVPRASERLAMEAKKEHDLRWTAHLQLQAPALMALVAGVTHDTDVLKDPDNRAQVAGIAVGAGWLAATTLLSAMYQPYADAHQEVAALPAKSTREQLVRERMAEESIRKAGRLGNTLKWLNVVSHLAVGGFMIPKATKGSFSVIMDAATMALAFTPVLFPQRWTTVAREQADYKRRIYGPVANAGLLPEPGTGKAAPALTLSMQF